MEYAIPKGFLLALLSLVFVVEGLSSSFEAQEGVVLNSNHQFLGTFDAFLDNEDLLHAASDQIFQKIVKKSESEASKPSEGTEKQSTFQFSRNKKENERTTNEKQANRAIRRFKVNPYEVKEPTDGKARPNSTRVVRVRKLKRKPLELLRTRDDVKPSEEKTKLKTRQQVEIPVSHIRVINSEERPQKRKKSKGRERTQKPLIPATNTERFFQPPTEASIQKASSNSYKALRLSNLPLVKKSEPITDGKATGFRSSQSVSVTVGTDSPPTRQLPSENYIPTKAPLPVKTHHGYIPILSTVPKAEGPKKNAKKQEDVTEEVNATAVPPPLVPTYPVVRIPQQYYYHPYTVIPPQALQRSVNFLQPNPHDPNAHLYANVPQYYQPVIQQPPNTANNPLYYSPQLSAGHPFFSNPQNNAPYRGWPDYSLAGLQPSPHLTSLRRSIWEDEEAEAKADIDEPATPFTIPKFDMPSIDYSHDGCQTKIREIKEVPFSDVPGHMPHSRQKRKVKSVILTRECYFPKGFPSEGKEILKSYVEETIKSSDNSPKKVKPLPNKESKLTTKPEEAKEILTASESKDNVLFSQPSGNENVPKFKEPYFHPQFGYIFDD